MQSKKANKKWAAAEVVDGGDAENLGTKGQG